MLRLTTFGGVLLRSDGEPHVGAASQRRRLALLVLVATAGARPVSRDKLIGILWPDSDAERARHALRQALHAIQSALGVESLFVGTTALHLDPAMISTDVDELESASDAGEHQRVVALYKGPFLDGFYVADAPEFERWADAQRARYAAMHAASLEALADEATARGDRTGAVTWWRRLTAAQPVSARYALGLMRALADAGDRTGALQFASVHGALVRQELGVDPDAGIGALAERLRTGAPAPSARAEARVASAVHGDTARSRARERQAAWLDRVLGARFDIDHRAVHSPGGPVDGYPAFDRGRRVPVEIHLLDAGVSAVADLDVLRARLDAVAALDDPHIATLYEHGQADGVVYYIVARADGASLRDRLARERQLALGDALGVARDVAAALAHAHGRGVVHGDLRPKYVHLTANGAVLSRLGIAGAIIGATSNARSTSTTLRVGAPAYQSPEQFTGDERRFDARSDVYSVGCIVYEMLAGEVPFASADPTQLVSAKFSAPVPSLRARRESVSPELDAIVQQCLARVPSDRYRDATELSAALAALR